METNELQAPIIGQVYVLQDLRFKYLPEVIVISKDNFHSDFKRHVWVGGYALHHTWFYNAYKLLDNNAAKVLYSK